jgi:hypothetical protein
MVEVSYCHLGFYQPSIPRAHSYIIAQIAVSIWTLHRADDASAIDGAVIVAIELRLSVHASVHHPG